MSDPIQLRQDIHLILRNLQPASFVARIEYGLRGGLPAGQSESVRKSRGFPIPQLDAEDRRLLVWRRQYDAALESAYASLALAHGVEAMVLLPIHVASKEEAAQASDFGVDCKRCARPVACTPADKLLAGFCASCHRWWVRNGRPDIIRPITETEVVEA